MNTDPRLRNSFKNDDIAIIGMSGRFPEADDLEQFWDNLIQSRESIREFPVSRREEFQDIIPGMDKMEFVKLGYLDKITQFEPELFSINRAESSYIDPQHRLLLELVEEAVLDSGYSPDDLSDGDVGVFVAGNQVNYTTRLFESSPMTLANSALSTNAGRIAYVYNLHGPTLALDTACSSSLVAIHYACQSLKTGEAKMAIAGGSQMILMPATQEGIEDIAIASKKQKVRTFDKDADGTVGGEGGGIVILKLLDKALEDNDHIHGIIKGSAINSDGRWSNGMSAPSQKGQAEVITRAVENAQIDPTTISYIETHGTGTVIGDPIEIDGIKAALDKYNYHPQSVPIASLKTNIGHLDAAAGVAGLIKTVLALKQKQIPASLNFETPNPLIPFEQTPIYVNDRPAAWESDTIRRAAVTSLGIIGTNCNVVLEEALLREQPRVEDEENIIVLSARTRDSLTGIVKKLKSHLEKNQHLPISDIAFTLNQGRRSLPYRYITQVTSTTDLIAKLESTLVEDEVLQVSNENEINPIFIIPDLHDIDLSKEVELNQAQYIQSDLLQGLKQVEVLTDHQATYLQQILTYVEILKTYSVKPKAVLGLGAGDIVADLVKQAIPLDEAVSKLKVYQGEKLEITEAKVAGVVGQIVKSGINTFIQILPDAELEVKFSNVLSEKDVLNIIFNHTEETLHSGIITLIKKGLKVNWQAVYAGRDLHRLSLPGYLFDRKAYFAKPDKLMNSLTLGQAATEEEENPVQIEEMDREGLRGNLQGLFNEIASTSEVDLDQSIHSFKLDSIDIMHYSARVKKEYGIEVPLKLFFEDRRLGDIFDQIIDTALGEDHAASPIEKQPEQEYYQLSSAQKRLFILDQMGGAKTSYNMPGALIIEGDLNLKRLEDTLREFVKRHESLRTAFEVVDGEGIQRIHEDSDFEIEYLTNDSTEMTIEDHLRAFVRPFELDQPSLFRVGLLELPPAEEQLRHLMIFDMHHIISDGVSMGIFMRDLITLYQGKQLPELAIQYKDFAHWQSEQFKTEEFQEMENYWLQQFASEIAVLELPTDHPRPEIKSFAGDRVEFEVGVELQEKLNQLGKENGATLYMVLLATYNILLSKYAGQEDIVVGSPIAGRPHSDLEDLIGMFVNTLAMRNYPAGEKSFTQFLNEVKENSLNAYQNQLYQFEMLVEKLDVKRDMSRSPVFDVMFVLQNMRFSSVEIGDMNFIPYQLETTNAKFDLTLNAFETQKGLKFALEYCTALFEKETMRRFGAHFINLLEAIVENVDLKLGDLEMVGPEERRQIVEEFNQTKVDYPEDQTIQKLFEEKAEQYPNQTAVVYQGQQITYRQLNERANQLARTLRVKGISVDRTVGIMAVSSIELMVGVLAIVKAGGTYLPLNIDYPKQRIEYMLEDTETHLILTKGEMPVDINFAGEILDLDDEQNYAYDSTNLYNVNKPTDLIYIIYTSGSTGNPKGAMIQHKNVNRLISNSSVLTITSEDRLLQTGSLAFDASTYEIWGAFLNGATLYLLSRDELLSSTRFIEELQNNKISWLFLTTALFNQLSEEDPTTFKGLKTLMVGGETLSPKHMNTVRHACPSLNLYNIYGPTESTTFATAFRLEKDYEENIPIGEPLSNTTVYIMDQNSKLLPVGVPGELCIGGDGLARGYLNNPEMTKEKFIPDPFNPGGRIYKSGDLACWLPDGNIQFMGRVDNQVKVRGFRIELGEIETEFFGIPEVNEAVVICNSADNGHKYLAAYFTADSELEITYLKEQLGVNLPAYMIPDYFILLAEMPLNHNGKINREALPSVEENMLQKAEYAPPTNETEEKLVEIWSEILEVNQIGINDNFFNIGGNSILAIKASARMIESGWKLNVQEIFEYPTIKEQADLILAGLDASVEPKIEDIDFPEVPETPTTPVRQKDREIKTILLTGATGYLGVHLVEELLLKTNAQIYCLVRGKDAAEAQERFRELLKFYFQEKYLAELGERVVILEGDIADKQLGLGEEKYQQLTQEVDTVIHAAALVKHFGNYDLFKRVNVEGTQNVIEFTQASGAVMNHISTMSVAGGFVKGAQRAKFTEKDFYIGQNYLDNVYNRSKFEAESRVLDAIQNGLQATIFRVGNLTGRYQDGHFQQNLEENAFYTNLKTLIYLGVVSKSSLDDQVEFTPVDLCSQAIVRIIKNEDSVSRVFHTYNDQFISLSELINLFIKSGIKIKALNNFQIRKHIESAREDEEKQELLSRMLVYSNLESDVGEKAGVDINCDITTDYLHQLDFQWNTIDEEYLEKIIDHMKETGFIEESYSKNPNMFDRFLAGIKRS